MLVSFSGLIFNVVI